MNRTRGRRSECTRTDLAFLRGCCTQQALTLCCNDALQLLAELPDESVDLVLFSPPYEKARQYEGTFRLEGEAWVAWFVGVMKECARVSRGLVAAVVAGRTKGRRWSAAPVLAMADLHRAGYCLRCPPIFYRHGIAGSGGNDWLRSDYEFVLALQRTPGKLPYVDQTACGAPPRFKPGGPMSHRTASDRRVNGHTNGSPRKPNGRRDRQKYKPPALTNPGTVIKAMYSAEDVQAILAEYGVPGFGDVLRVNVGGNRMGDPLAHHNEAPFPLGLADFFVRTFCPPNGLVLDPMMGSGTTLHAARLADRRGLGCDNRMSQYRLASRRLRNARPLEEMPELTALAAFDELEYVRKVKRAVALRALEGFRP